MSVLPNFHDGYFDGLYLSDHRTAHLFLRTVGTRLVCGAQQSGSSASGPLSEPAISFWVLLSVIQIASEHIQECYDLSDVDHSQQVAQLLESARQKQLIVVEMSPSYGAELTALCAEIDVCIRHPLLQT